jgi:hypothetical protein
MMLRITLFSEVKKSFFVLLSAFKRAFLNIKEAKCIVPKE